MKARHGKIRTSHFIAQMQEDVMIRLCAVTELNDTGSKSFHNQRGHIFVVRKGEHIYLG